MKASKGIHDRGTKELMEIQASKGIHDGRTKELMEIQKCFEKMRTEANKMFHIDDFIYQGNKLNNVLNKYLKKWKNFPKNRYVINFLCLLFFYSCGQDELKKLFKEQESQRPLSESSEKILTDLTEFLIRSIEEIGEDEIRRDLEEKYTPEVIRDNLMDLKEDFFLEFLAPVCDMDKDEADIFMLRVFKRDPLSPYRTGEYLLWLAMDIYIRRKKETTIEILYKLKAFYDSVSPAAEQETISGEGGTRYITEKSETLLDEISLENQETFEVGDYPQLGELLSWYKAAVKPSARDRKEAYKELFDETFHLYGSEMKDFIRVTRPEEKMRAKLFHRRELSVPITIWYDNSNSKFPYWIKKGTRFFGENCKYELPNYETLLPADYVKACIHVIPHEANSELSCKRKFVPEGTVFHIVEGNSWKNGKLVIRSVEVMPLGKMNLEEIVNFNPESMKDSNEWTKPKWKLEYKKKKNGGKISGFVVIEVMVGERIPEDLCLEYEGFKFDLYDKSEVAEPFFSRKVVTAHLDLGQMPFYNAKPDNEENVYILDGTSSITRMEPVPDVVVGVSNLKNRVTVCQDRFDREHFEQTGELIIKDLMNLTGNENYLGEEIAFIDHELFEHYMYGQEDYDIVSNLDIELTKKTGLKMKNLSSDWLLDSRAQGDEQWFSELNEHSQRSVVLALLFLQYIKKNDKLAMTNRERFVRGFRVFVDNRMKRFRFDGLYLGYPLDCFLMFLLGTCVPPDMCDTLRMLYKENDRVVTSSPT